MKYRISKLIPLRFHWTGLARSDNGDKWELQSHTWWQWRDRVLRDRVVNFPSKFIPA